MPVTYDQLKRYYLWPQMFMDITRYIKSCKICQKNKYDRHPTKQMFQLTEQAERPFTHLHSDTLTVDNEIFLTITDAFTRYAQTYPIPGKTAVAVCEFIELFSTDSAPKYITMDKGLEFNNITLQELLKLYKVHMHYTTPQNPNSNATIERLHSNGIFK